MLNAQLPFGPAISFLDIYRREMKTCLHEDLYSNVHSSFIHIRKHKTKKPTKVHQWLKKWIVIYPESNTTQQQKINCGVLQGG